MNRHVRIVYIVLTLIALSLFAAGCLGEYVEGLRMDGRWP